MRHILALAALAALTACSAPILRAPPPLPEPVMEPEPVYHDPTATAEVCPGDGDGIGGTGCRID